MKIRKVSVGLILFLFCVAMPIYGTVLGQAQLEKQIQTPSFDETLEKLDQLIKELVEGEEIVGGEILVIQKGKKRLHRGYGWSDQESKTAMGTDGVFCVRSMTKPLVGTAILMLVADGKLKLDDRIADYLPSFDAKSTRDITVKQLLTHTSGLPMSLLVGKDLNSLEGIQEVAELGGGIELLSNPGERFRYSDQGTDTLTALIEVVSKLPAAEFINHRVLHPIGMTNSTCVMGVDQELRSRSISNYAGSQGEWSRFWSSDDPPFLPFFLGSQGLYSTTEDYAKFMDFWNNHGKVEGEVLLDPLLIRQALSPSPHEFKSNTGFPHLVSKYGFLMQLWMSPDEKGDQVAVFGHSGSDGTHAWVFPEQDAMVMYFTQSRGNLTGLRVESILGELFLGVPINVVEKTEKTIDEYLGYYRENESDLYRAIIRDGEDMALEVVGRGIVTLDFLGEDRWCFRQNPNQVIQFDRSEDGQISGYHIGDHQEYRFQPSDELPTGKEISERVSETHQVGLLETLGPIRLNEKLTIEKFGLEGTSTSTFAWPDRWKEENLVAGNFENLSFDGHDGWSESSAKSVEQLPAKQAIELRNASIAVRFGDWSNYFDRVQVIQRLKGPDGDVFVVRAGDTSATAGTYYVDAEKHRVFREDRIVYVEQIGRVGQRVKFQDFRDVSGILLPYQTQVEIAHPMVGQIISIKTMVDSEIGIELPENAFQLKK